MDEKIKKLRDKSYANAERLILQAPARDLEWLLNDIWDYNAKLWIDDKSHHDTIGFESVMKHGFTTNQLMWIHNIFALLKSNDEQVEVHNTKCNFSAVVPDIQEDGVPVILCILKYKIYEHLGKDKYGYWKCDGEECIFQRVLKEASR